MKKKPPLKKALRVVLKLAEKTIMEDEIICCGSVALEKQLMWWEAFDIVKDFTDILEGK